MQSIYGNRVIVKNKDSDKTMTRNVGKASKKKITIKEIQEVVKKHLASFKKRPPEFKRAAYVIGIIAIFLIVIWIWPSNFKEKLEEEKTVAIKVEKKTEESSVFLDKEIDKKAYVKRLDSKYGDVESRVEEQEKQTRDMKNSLEDIKQTVRDLKKEGKGTGREIKNIKKVLDDMNEAIQTLTGKPVGGFKAKVRRYLLGEERPIFEGEVKTGEAERKKYEVPRGSMASKITVIQVEEKAKKEVVPEEEVFLMLPAGSFVECTLLSGVYAPADSSRPLPVLIRMDDAFIGPNKSKVPLEGIFGLCKATGELVSERAILQLQQISVVMKDGKTFNEEGNLGYLAGEDAALGLKGKIIRNTGKYIWMALFSGYLGGAADALAMGKTQTTIGGQGQIVQDINKKATGDYAAYSGFSSAAQRMSDYYMGQLEQLIPVVYIAAGRKITVVMTKSIKIKGYKLEKYDRYLEEEY